MASTKTNAAPITAHPAFPLVVALWFAALLGLGSLILPAALIERLVTSTGIAQLIPAAAPPLGFTARAAIAVGGTVLGALLGLLAARQLARPGLETARRRSIGTDRNSRRQPVSALEELGSPSFDSVAGFATTRRKALAGEEESRLSDFLQRVPLEETSEPHGFTDGIISEQHAAEQALDLGDCAEFTDAQELPEDTASQEEKVVMTQLSAPLRSRRRAELVASDPLLFSPPSMARRPAPVDFPDMGEFATFEEDHGLVPAQPEAASQPEPRQYFIPPEPEQEDAAPEATDEPAATALPEPEPEPEPGPEPGLVQLVEQLGAALERRREWSALHKAQQPESPRFPRAVMLNNPAELAANFEPAAPNEAAQAMAAFFSSPEAQESPAADEPLPTVTGDPSQFQPFSDLGHIEAAEDDDLDQIAASLSLPLGRIPAVRSAPPAAEPAAEIAAPDAKAEAPGSLHVMKNPFRDSRREFVRVDEPEQETNAAPPAVVFPRAAPTARMFDRPLAANRAASVAEIPAASVAPRPATSNADNDRVLREALMNLQRINKN